MGNTGTAQAPGSLGQAEPGASQDGAARYFGAFFHQPLRKLGVSALIVYLFLKFGLVHEFVASKTGIDTHIILLVTLLAFASCFASGAMPRIFRSRIGVCMLLFSFWLVLAVPFSSWRGGSFAYVFNFYLRTAVPIFWALCVLPAGLGDVRRLCVAVGWGAVVAALLGRSFSSLAAGGRATMDFGSIRNSGDLAAFYIVSLPFLFYLFHAKKNWFVRALIIVLFLSNVQLVLSTAARSALVALGAGVFFVLLWGRPALRVLVLCTAIGAVLGAGLFLPASVLNRFSSLTGGDSEEAIEAQYSKEARKAVAERALKYTFQNPIFGVGPNVFQDYDAKVTLDAGARRAQWQETHNGYLQISVEAGIPALLFKLTAAGSAFFTVLGVYRRTRKEKRLEELGPVCFCLMTSLSLALVFEFFLSQGYAFWTLVVLALTAALQFSLKEDPLLLGGTAMPTAPAGIALRRPPILEAARPLPPVTPLATRRERLGGRPRTGRDFA